MHLKGVLFLAGICLGVSSSYGWVYPSISYRPCSMAPWKGFPMVQFADTESFFNDWSDIINDKFWPLSLPFETEWENNLLENSKTEQPNVPRTLKHVDQERQRLQRMYDNSVEKSRQIQDEMTKIKKQLDHFNDKSSSRESTNSFRSPTPHSSCYQNQRQNIRQNEDSNPRQSHHQRGSLRRQENYDRRPRENLNHHPSPNGPDHHHQPPQTQKTPDQLHSTQKPHVSRQHQTHAVPTPLKRTADQTHSIGRHQNSHDVKKPHPDPYQNSHPENRAHVKHRERDVTTSSPIQDVLLIPTRGFNPRDLKIHHHGNSIRVHASRTCGNQQNCVTRELETSYKLPYRIERGSMKASFDGTNIVIKGRPLPAEDIPVLVEEISEDSMFSGEDGLTTGTYSHTFDDKHAGERQWILEDSDYESDVSVETEN